MHPHGGSRPHIGDAGGSERLRGRPLINGNSLKDQVRGLGVRNCWPRSASTVPSLGGRAGTARAALRPAMWRRERDGPARAELDWRPETAVRARCGRSRSRRPAGALALFKAFASRLKRDSARAGRRDPRARRAVRLEKTWRLPQRWARGARSFRFRRPAGGARLELERLTGAGPRAAPTAGNRRRHRGDAGAGKTRLPKSSRPGPARRRVVAQFARSPPAATIGARIGDRAPGLLDAGIAGAPRTRSPSCGDGTPALGGPREVLQAVADERPVVVFVDERTGRPGVAARACAVIRDLCARPSHSSSP